jgi:hypothetical protein
MDILISNFNKMEEHLKDQIFGLQYKLAETKKEECDLLEQVKRHVGDLASSSSSINKKLDRLSRDKSHPDKETNHVQFNNPYMDIKSPKFPSRRNRDFTPPRRGHAPQEHSYNSAAHNSSPLCTPQWQIEFPSINHENIDVEMRKEQEH